MPTPIAILETLSSTSWTTLTARNKIASPTRQTSASLPGLQAAYQELLPLFLLLAARETRRGVTNEGARQQTRATPADEGSSSGGMMVIAE